MPARSLTAALFAISGPLAMAAPIAALAWAAAARADEPAITPFSAHYTADWKSLNVGTSDLDLKRIAADGTYEYTWRITARGVLRMVYSDDVIQKSWFGVHGDHVRPEKYRAEQGNSTVSIDF